MNSTRETTDEMETRLVRLEELVEFALEGHTIPQLMVGLRDEDPSQRQKAAHYLYRVGELALPAIMGMISDDDEPKHARIDAIELLGSMGEVAEEAIPTLVDLLRTMADDEDFLTTITSALTQIDGTVVLTLAKAWLEAPDDVFIESLCSVEGAVIPTLIDALSDEDGQICMAAAYILYRIDDTRSDMVLRVLMGGLSDGEAEVRYHAVRALQLMPLTAVHKAVPALSKALGDQDESVAEIAAYILVDLGEAPDKVVPVLIRAMLCREAQLQLFPIPRRPTEALAQAGVKAARSLAELLGHEDRDLRSQAAWALAAMGRDSESALPELVEALSDMVPSVYENASQALISIGGDATPTLLDALQEPARICQRIIHQATADIGSPSIASQVLRSLVYELEHADSLFHWELLGLTKCRDVDSARAVFVQWLMEEDDDLPEYDVNEDIESHEYRTFPWRFLGVIERQFREACLRVLHVLSEMAEQAAPAVPSLFELYECGWLPAEVRVRIPQTLVSIGHPAEKIAEGLVECMLRDGGGFDEDAARALTWLGEYAQDAIPGLLITLDSPDGNEREVAAEVLVSIGEASVPLLIQALDTFMGDDAYYEARDIMFQIGNSTPHLVTAIRNLDNTPQVRCDAARLLSEIQAEVGADEDSVSTLLEALTDEQVRGTAAGALAQIAKMDERVIPALVEALGDDEPSFRADVAYALAGTGNAASAAIPLLTRLANDNVTEVRKAAEYALHEIGNPESTHTM